MLTREELLQDLRYKSANHIERFAIELLFRLVRNEGSIVTKEELQQLKSQYLMKDCPSKDAEQRKKLYGMLKKALLYCGMVTKNAEDGLKWVFQSPNDKC